MKSIVGKKVHLITDLTRYHRNLVDGAEGVIVNEISNRGDAFVDVRFARAGVWPILYRSIEIESLTDTEINEMLNEVADDAECCGFVEKAKKIRALTSVECAVTS